MRCLVAGTKNFEVEQLKDTVSRLIPYTTAWTLLNLESRKASSNWKIFIDDDQAVKLDFAIHRGLLQAILLPLDSQTSLRLLGVQSPRGTKLSSGAMWPGCDPSTWW